MTDDWTLRRCQSPTGGPCITIRPPESLEATQRGHDVIASPASPGHSADRILYALCDALIREREAYTPSPDGPVPLRYEAIASDIDALVIQHMMIVDRYAVLYRASLDSSSPYAQRCCSQARLDVADSVHRLRALR